MIRYEWERVVWGFVLGVMACLIADMVILLIGKANT